MTLREKKELEVARQVIKDIQQNGFRLPISLEEIKMGVGKQRRRQYHKAQRKVR